MYRASKIKNRNHQGADGVSFESFNASRAGQIRSISSLLKTQSYTFTSLHPFFAPKPDGKERLICVPTLPDRLVQRAIYRHLAQSRYSFDNDISFGFIKGKSTRSALHNCIRYRAKNSWVYKADISTFFDSIDRDILKDLLRKKLRIRSIIPLLDQVIDTEVSPTNLDDRKRIRSMGIQVGTGLRQGMPLSPYLANLLLWDFDQFLIANKIKAIRYADDIIAFGSSKSECEDVHALCSSALADVALNIHALGASTKTKIYSPHETAEFLGIGISRKTSDGKYSLTVTKEQANVIKNRILQLSDLSYLAKRGITFSKLVRRVDSKIQSYISTYSECENKDKVRSMMLDVRQNLLKNVLSASGIQLDNLNKKQRLFLEIDAYIS